MRNADGFYQVRFSNFIAFAFYHHNNVHTGRYDEVHISLSQFCPLRVDDVFAVDARYANLGNRSLERNVGNSKSR